MPYVALIPAAGAGTRLAAGAPAGVQPAGLHPAGVHVPGPLAVAKQYLPLAGRPMLYHAIKSVAVSPIETVFVVLAPDDTSFAEQDWSEFEGRLAPLYCGGATRRESVCNGLVAAMAAVDADDWVLVHDAARPCLPQADLERLIDEVKDDAVGGLLALPVTDTVKRARADAGARVEAESAVRAGLAGVRVATTEAREQLWLAQTPQMFRAGLLAEALRDARGTLTDEASAVEAMGLQPKLVTGSRRNFKVTFAEDLAVAEYFLANFLAQRSG